MLALPIVVIAKEQTKIPIFCRLSPEHLNIKDLAIKFIFLTNLSKAGGINRVKFVGVTEVKVVLIQCATDRKSVV